MELQADRQQDAASSSRALEEPTALDSERNENEEVGHGIGNLRLTNDRIVAVAGASEADERNAEEGGDHCEGDLAMACVSLV